MGVTLVDEGAESIDLDVGLGRGFAVEPVPSDVASELAIVLQLTSQRLQQHRLAVAGWCQYQCHLTRPYLARQRAERVQLLSQSEAGSRHCIANELPHGGDGLVLGYDGHGCR